MNNALAGNRVFDVLLEDNLVIDDFDPIAESGPYAPSIKSFVVTVTDGKLTIKYKASVDNAKISAIAIRPGNDLPTIPVVTIPDFTDISLAANTSQIIDLSGITGSSQIRITTALPSGNLEDVDSSLVNLNGTDLEITPSATDVGSYIVRVSAANAQGGSASKTFNLTITEEVANTAPIIEPVADINGIVGDELDLGFSVTDLEDLTTITFEVKDPSDNTVPAGAYTFTDLGDNNATLLWNTTGLDAGLYMATITANDGTNLPVSLSFNIDLQEDSNTDPNTAPVFGSINMTPLSEGQSLTVPISITDADGDALVVAISTTSDEPQLLQSANSDANNQVDPFPINADGFMTIQNVVNVGGSYTADLVFNPTFGDGGGAETSNLG
ncbi:MAG: malectin domain-containing carbohydrate-binding protein, partial [Bacteroidota bacterium]